MTSSIVNALGAGSGIDTTALVRDLAAASRAPKIDRLDGLARTNQARISAVAQLKSNIESFASSLESVVNGGSLSTRPTVSDETVIAATSVAGRQLFDQSSEIKVQSLARAQTAYSATIANATNPIGQGSLTLRVGTTDHVITIGSGNDSLAGLASAINASGSGVTANLVNDTGGARLVLKGQSGTANSFTLTPDAGADPGLSLFGTSGGLTPGQPAQDAVFSVDGVNYTRSTNTIADVIPGVSLTLKKESPTNAITVGTQRSTETLRQTVADFVSVFNDVRRSVARAREAGNDQGLRLLDQQLAALVGKQLSSDSQIKSLSDIGVTTNRDGSVTLNAARLTAVLRDNPQQVEALFIPVRDGTRNATTDPGLSASLNAIKTNSLGSNGPISALEDRLKKRAAVLVQDRTRVDERENAYQRRLERQFGGLDGRINALKATQSYLRQQFKISSDQ